jgi:uncharacterized protein YjbI with pentapeptide repeats
LLISRTPYFLNTILRGADLTQTDLEDADLTGADLTLIGVLTMVL